MEKTTNEKWLSIKEMARWLGITEQAIRKKNAQREIPLDYIRTIKGKRGGKSGKSYLISTMYLYEQNRRRWCIWYGEEISLKHPEIKDDKGVGIPIDGMTEWQLKKAVERVEIVKEIKRIRMMNPGNQTCAIEEYAKKLKKTRSTIVNYEKTYDKYGIGGLAPMHGRNRGERISLHPDVEGFIKSFYLRPQRPSVRETWEYTQQFCRMHGYREVCYNTVLNFLKQDIPEELHVWCREGETAWEAKCAPYFPRDLNDLEPNEMWVADSRVMDIFVYIYKDREVAIRPWIILIEDLSSRTFVGWRLCLQPDSWQIALAFRDGILRNGLPGAVYIDNGKDYCSRYLSGGVRKKGKSKMNIETESVLASLRVRINHALPYNPQSKPIEPAFRIFHRLERECPGWCGKDNKERPEKFKEEERKRSFLTFEEFHKRVSEHIEWYNNRYHKTLGMTPNERRKNCTFTTVDERDLNILLLKKEKVQIYKHGIKLMNLTWWADEFQTRLFTGNIVDVRYCPDDVSKIWVYRNDQFICHAYPQEKISAVATEKDLKKVGKRKSTARKRMRALEKERKIAISNKEALKAIIDEKVREPDIGKKTEEQGPTSPNITEKKIIKETFMRLEEEGKDPHAPDRSLHNIEETPKRRQRRPMPPPRKTNDDLHSLNFNDGTKLEDWGPFIDPEPKEDDDEGWGPFIDPEPKKEDDDINFDFS